LDTLPTAEKAREVHEICQSIIACRDLFEAQVLTSGLDRMVERAATTSLLIELNDLLTQMENEQNPLNSTTLIHPNCTAKSVGQLIRLARNAACHARSFQHLTRSGIHKGGDRFSYITLIGKGSVGIGGMPFACEFADDAAIIYGSNMVYFERHLGASFDAAKEYFSKTRNLNFKYSEKKRRF
jgi:hypothetical protein